VMRRMAWPESTDVDQPIGRGGDAGPVEGGRFCRSAIARVAGLPVPAT
jgi:hypothetical protein